MWILYGGYLQLYTRHLNISSVFLQIKHSKSTGKEWKVDFMPLTRASPLFCRTHMCCLRLRRKPDVAIFKWTLELSPPNPNLLFTGWLHSSRSHFWQQHSPYIIQTGTIRHCSELWSIRETTFLHSAFCASDVDHQDEVVLFFQHHLIPRNIYRNVSCLLLSVVFFHLLFGLMG